MLEGTVTVLLSVLLFGTLTLLSPTGILLSLETGILWSIPVEVFPDDTSASYLSLKETLEYTPPLAPALTPLP